MTPLVQKRIFVYFSKTISFSTPSHYNAPTHKQINQKNYNNPFKEIHWPDLIFFYGKRHYCFYIYI